MALVPLEPHFTGIVHPQAVVPECRPPEVHKPPLEGMTPLQEDAVKGVVAIHVSVQMMCEMQRQQRARVEERCSTEQWLDENEREWRTMDEMLRSRPWVTDDKEFPYPFRETTNEMREAEGPWVGDDRDPPKLRRNTRIDAPSEVLVHLRGVAEHPPPQRVILFTPEFGSEHSFDAKVWRALPPVDTCDLWIVSWQGWPDFEEMIEQVKVKVLSFADAVSTVWVAHSMGAIVAYELLKRFEGHATPNLPVALMVSGCPAPDLFQEQFQPHRKYEWLAKLRSSRDFDRLTQEQVRVLQKEFQVFPTYEVEPFTLNALSRGIAPAAVREKYSADPPPISPEQRLAIMGDLKIVRSYRFERDEDTRRLVIPVIAVSSDSDPLVDPSSVEAWRGYVCNDSDFEYVELEDIADEKLVAKQGHGFLRQPAAGLLEKLVAVNKKYQLMKEIDDMLPDIGPTDGPIPEYSDCVVVGGGIAGVTQGKALVEKGYSVVVFEKYRTVGGIWIFFANNYSRVNSSEPAYRIVNYVGKNCRPNEDHSPRHDILRDIYTVTNKYLHGMIRCHIEVTKCTKREDGTYDVKSKNVKTGQVSSTHTKVVSFHVNRRIGKRRILTYPNAKHFRGDEVYGYANEMVGLNFWGKRVIVVGAGAFAFENLRTAIEHGAKHCTILGRRAGTTCPKWIDMIAFIRPTDMYFNTNRNGNIISFDCWRKCYEDAGLPTPECWEEGLLKPHNHTVSVSDLAYIGGLHGMVDLKVGEIKCFRPDGQGIELMDGSKLEVDIVIKATGFHLNPDVEAITGYRKMHSFNLMDFNLNYGAEPLLDGGQFGSAKGQMEKVFEEDVTQEDFVKGMTRYQEFQLPDITPRANPFGSAYVGGMLQTAYNFAWLVENPEYQKALLRAAGKPEGDTVEQWASHVGMNQSQNLKKMIARLG